MRDFALGGYRDAVLAGHQIDGAREDRPRLEAVLHDHATEAAIQYAALLYQDLPIQPVNFYGAAKAAVDAERYQRSWRNAGLCPALFQRVRAEAQGRTGEGHDRQTLIPLVLQAAAGLRPAISDFGSDYPTPDGTCMRDKVHVTDLARGHAAALARSQGKAPDADFFRAINLGTNPGHSIREVIEVTKYVTGIAFKVISAAQREGDPVTLSGDPGRAQPGWL